MTYNVTCANRPPVSTFYMSLGGTRFDYVFLYFVCILLYIPPGTVSLWSPNVKEPLARLLCQRGGVRAVSVSSDGQYMATAGVDRTLGLWDLRMLKQLRGHRVSGAGAGQLGFSQTGLLAAGLGNTVQVGGMSPM